MKTFVAALLLITAPTAFAQVLATIGNTKVTVEEFSRKLSEIQRQAANPPTATQYLEDLTRFEIGVQQAEKIKLENDPSVKERIKQVLYTSLLEKELGKKLEGQKVTESEMKDFYKKNQELHVAHILIETKPNSTKDEKESARKRALDVFADVKKAKSQFEELARLHSEDASTKEAGGDIGYHSRATLIPALYDAVLSMKPGEVKGPIETRFGFHIIKLLDRRDFELADKRQVRATVLEAKRMKVVEDYFDRIKKNFKVQINREALKGVGN